MDIISRTVTPNRWDRAGILVSGACAIHCTLLPLLLAAVPVLGLGRLLDDRIEWGFVIMTAVIGTMAHLRAYLADHRHVAPGLVFAAGFSLVLCARLFLEDRRLGPYTVGLGGILAAVSHYANLRLCQCCGECERAAQTTIASGGLFRASRVRARPRGTGL
jgi:MerC mercury resistance protein